MDEIFLTVKEVARLKDCSERYVRTLISNKKLSASEIIGQATGQGGIQYRIPLSGLDNKLQIKYKRFQRKQENQNAEPPTDQPEPLYLNYESLTDKERESIALWKRIIRDWDMYRSAATSKAEGDVKFLQYIETNRGSYPGLEKIPTVHTLYRKRKALYSVDETGLLDGRGKHENHTRKLTAEMLDIFEYYYLDESKKTVKLCMFLVERELKRRNGETPVLPSSDTFERAVKKIPIPYVMYFRESLKEFIGKCAPYIKRMYEDLEPNDIWVADNHTFDVMVANEDKSVRLYLTMFMDVRTRKMMGWCVTDAPCADATIYALKKGIEKYGVPKILYTDNGREFLFHDFGGNGFRKKAKVKPGEFKPPTILEELGIQFTTALPTNARAKGIERAFETIKENFSKLFFSYTGGNVLEKPDRLKDVVKKPELLPKIQDFIKCVDTYLTGYYNKQPHSGEGMWGMSPDEVFAENLCEKRIVPEDKLNIMFMRYSKGTIKVGKNGVTMKLYGQELQYTTEDLWREFFGKDVYVRYNPDDLSSVRVYTTDNQLICVAPLKTKLSYMATKEAVQEANRQDNAAVKTVKNYKKLKAVKAQSALDAVLDAAIENLETPENIDPDVLRIIQSGEIPLQKAVGCDAEPDDPIDWTAALQRQKERKLNQM